MNRLRVFVYAVRPAYIDIHLAAKLSATKVKQLLKGVRAVLVVNGDEYTAEGAQLLDAPARGYDVRFGMAVADSQLELKAGDSVEVLLTVDGEDLGKEIVTVTAPAGPGQELVEEARHARDAVSLYAAYPILTSAAAPDGGGGPAGAGTGDARSAVQREWGNVLGRVPRNGDLTATLAALGRRFVPSAEADTDTYVWTDRPTSVMSETMVGVSGEQASLVALAQRVTDEIDQRVKEARPLRQRADNPEEVEVLRSNLWESWTAFVNTIGTEGGVPTARAAVLLRQAREQLGAFGVELGMIDPNAYETL